ncbi:MAG: hypothetical protein ACRETP_02810, partial [Steroidobacteraceae bacterium]
MCQLFRDLNWNKSRPTVEGLKKASHDGLPDNVSNFLAVVMIGEWAHLFHVRGDGSVLAMDFRRDQRQSCRSAGRERVEIDRRFFQREGGRRPSLIPALAPLRHASPPG